MKRAFGSAWLGQFRRWATWIALLSALLPAHAQPSFLAPEEAFRLSVSERGDGIVRLHWDIASGYYLYRDRIDASGEGAGAVTRPPGQTKDDPNFGTVEVYHDAVDVQVAAGRARTLRVTWQGCADEGLCYPPQHKVLTLAGGGSGGGAGDSAGGSGSSSGSGSSTSGSSTSGSGSGSSSNSNSSGGGGVGGGGASPDAAAAAAPSGARTAALAFGSDSEVSRLLAQRPLAWTLPLFFALGIALAFTPCTLPMVPILSSIVVGSGATPRRGLLLSLAFVVPMAAVYAALGVLAAWAGAGLQGWMQNPWLLLSFAAVFVALAAAMFGFYELQLPRVLRDRLARPSPQGGSLAGAATLGVLSALLVGPCMTAPLAGTLLYIAQGGSAAEGGLLLLALGLGMGLPLVVISTLGARWLPRPGAWMNRVKAAFGFVLLGTAIWMAQRVLAPPAGVVLWGAWLVALAMSLWHLAPAAAAESAAAWRIAARTGAAVSGLWGAAMVLGGAAGASDPAQPLRALAGAPAVAAAPAAPFETVQDMALLQRRLADAAARGQPAVVEFSADWCTSCKTIEREVFGDPRVGQALQGVVLLRADVTRSDAAQLGFMREHQVMGPPTLMLFGPRGDERREQRLVGEFAADALLERLAQTRGS